MLTYKYIPLTVRPPPPPAFPVRMMVLVDMRTMVLNFDLFFS